tara:strand:- start:49 stop:162 length:114 start_codon:yes stop_codon:yes gene_type:complete
MRNLKGSRNCDADPKKGVEKNVSLPNMGRVSFLRVNV